MKKKFDYTMEGKRPMTLANLDDGGLKDDKRPRFTVQQLEELKQVSRDNAFNSMPKVRGCDCPTCNGQIGVPS